MNSRKPRLGGVLASTALALLMAVPAEAMPPTPTPGADGTVRHLPGFLLVQDEEAQSEGEGQDVPRRRRQGQAEEQPAEAQQGEQPRRNRRSQEQQETQQQEGEAEQPRRRQRQQQAEEAQPAPEQAEESPRERRRRQQREQAREEAAPEQASPEQAEEAPREQRRRRQAAEEQQRQEEAAPAEQAGETPRERRRREQRERAQQQEAQPEAEQAEESDRERRRRQQREQAQEEERRNAEAQQAEREREAVRERERQADEAQAEANDRAQRRRQQREQGQQREEEAGQQAEETPRERRQRQRREQAEQRQQTEQQQAGESDRERRRRERQARENSELPPGEAPSANAEQRGSDDGDDETANRRPRRERAEGPPPSDDRAAQAEVRPERVESVDSEQGTRRRDSRRDGESEVRRRERPSGTDVVRELGDRLILRFNDQTIVESNDRPRLNRNARDVYTEDLPRQRTRETVVRGDGTRVVTIRNRYGDVIRRSRITPDGREYVLNYVDEEDTERVRDWRDPGLDLPPFRPNVPEEDYILDAEAAPSEEDYYTFLEKPPVERVERLYSLDEVKRSARVRQKTRRVDLDTITFDFGSASVPETQIEKLDGVASAMERLLEKNPAETFLIEGHTDAVGSDEANLALSDRRAEAVAEALTNVFDIPPENLATQGYGEQYLKVRTSAAERENRRVAIRRITPLVTPVASAQ